MKRLLVYLLASVAIASGAKAQDMKSVPLTFEATEDGTTVTITNPKGLTIEYSTDGGGSWTSSNANPITISGIGAGGTVQLHGDNEAYSTNGMSTGSTMIGCSADCYVYGNVMSLINSTSFATLTEFSADNALSSLFYGNAHLKNHATKNLVLPATTLRRGCYRGMFSGNTGLTSAPVLPATTMAPLCYYFMFNGCSNITTAPELPATELADSCYMTMFQACGLTAAPALPATTLAKSCYMNMFRACSKLSVAPVLPATTLTESCYEYMLCSTPLTEAPLLPATTLAKRCYFGMFLSCENLTSAPTLPATTLEESCYNGMFYGSGLTSTPALPATTVPTYAYSQMFAYCNSLTSVPALTAARVDRLGYRWMFQGCGALTASPAILATSLGEDACYYMFKDCINLETAGDIAATDLEPACCEYMFSGCTKLTKAPELPATTLAEQCYQRMFEECHLLVTAPELPATNLAYLCYNDMFWNCTSLKNAPVLPATKLADYCYTMMFLGCSSLETAPDLPAATLTPGCYEHMFMNCNSLNYVKCLATDLGDASSTDGWLTNVAATGTFVQAAGQDWNAKGTTEGTWGDPGFEVPCTFVHGIPTGWTAQVNPTAEVQLNSDGEGNYWATYYCSAGNTADASTTVYTAKLSSDQTKVELAEVPGRVIPAGNAVILKSSAEFATMTYTSAATGTLADNDLLGTAATISTPANTYLLINGNSGVGFYNYPTEYDSYGTPIGTTIPAGRGYLTIPGGGSVKAFYPLGGDEGTTAIEMAEDASEVGDAVLYDLSGRRVQGTPRSGIYIKNGKMVIIK